MTDSKSHDSGWLGQRSVAFWTVIAGVVAVIGLVITLAQALGDPTPKPSPSPSPPPSPSPSPDGNGQSSPDDSPSPHNNSITVPTAYQGTWSGVVTRTDGTLSFPVNIEVSGGGLGDRIGTLQLLNGSCRGFLYLETENSSSIIVRETFTYNATAGCSTVAEVQLSPQGSNSLNYYLTAAQYGNGRSEQANPIAAGILTRQ